MFGFQIGLYLNHIVREGLSREALRPDILITTAQPPYPHPHNKACICTSQDLSATPLEKQSGLWRWDTAQQPVTIINYWRTSNSMSE